MVLFLLCYFPHLVPQIKKWQRYESREILEGDGKRRAVGTSLYT